MIIFRTDFSPYIGNGHLSRCSILSREFQKLGYHTLLLTTSQTQELETIYFNQVVTGYETTLVEHCDSADIVIIDQYSLNDEVHRYYKKKSKFVCCIDDLTKKRYECDMIIDGNLTRTAADYLPYLVNKNCDFILGHAGQIVDEKYKHALPTMDYENRNPRNIYMSLGAYNHYSLLEKIINYYRESKPELKFGIPNTNGRFDYLQARNVELLTSKDEMVNYASMADTGIGAAGTMTWERNACLLPTFHIIVSNNQLQVAQDMKELFSSPFFDYLNDRNDKKLLSLLDEFIDNQKLRKEIFRKLLSVRQETSVSSIAGRILDAA